MILETAFFFFFLVTEGKRYLMSPPKFRSYLFMFGVETMAIRGYNTLNIIDLFAVKENSGTT